MSEEKPFDTVGFIMSFEDGTATDAEIINGFQHLVDSGQAWTLQGAYGRAAASLLVAGEIQATTETAKRVLERERGRL